MVSLGRALFTYQGAITPVMSSRFGFSRLNSGAIGTNAASLETLTIRTRPGELADVAVKDISGRSVLIRRKCAR